MELNDRPRPLVLGIWFLVASVFLYLGIAMNLLDPGGYHKSRFEIAIPLVIFVSPALLMTFRIAWMLRRPGLSQLKGRSLWLTIPLSLGGVVLGAVLISVALFREHWVELFWH
jgi:hypothetical protein